MSDWNAAIEAAALTIEVDCMEQAEANNAGWVDCVPTIGLAIEKALADVASLVRALKRPEALDGWKLVPVQPTPEMLEPMAREDCKRDGLDPDEPEPPHGHYPRWYGRCSAYDAMYRAMLAAAPTPPEEMK